MKQTPIEVRLAGKGPIFADGQLHVTYTVTNASREPVHLVDVPPECCIERVVTPNACAAPEATLNFCCAETPLEPNMGAYMFAEPAYAILEPGASVEAEAVTELPIYKEDVDLSGDIEFFEVPLPNVLSVAVSIGFIVRPFDVDEGETRVRDAFLRHQEIARSNEARIEWVND